jgi:hypothetical protein
MLREASSQRSQDGMVEDEDVLMKEEEEREVNKKVDFSSFIGQGDADPDKLVAMQDYLHQQYDR